MARLVGLAQDGTQKDVARVATEATSMHQRNVVNKAIFGFRNKRGSCSEAFACNCAITTRLFFVWLLF